MGSEDKKRYVIVGTGGRARIFTDPIAKRYADRAELVGMCDTNPGRLEYYNQILAGELGYHPVATYIAQDFDRMLAETKPDTVLVSTMDRFHHDYVIRGLNAGCDVAVEKPLTIDAEKCNAILKAVRESGKQLRVMHNYRWGPGTSLVKKLLKEQVIGQIISVNLEYLLDVRHGADYFRRWHRQKENSGGLLIHKASHHFDLVNWWINAVPDTIYGFGRLGFYGQDNAEKRGEKVTYDRYTGNDTTGDPFALHLDGGNEALRKLYLEPEKYDGYRRDQNVLGQGITIEDTMSVLVKYRTGVALNYSLNAFLPREGVHVSFNGTKGRLEYTEDHSSHLITGESEEQLAAATAWHNRCIVLPMFDKAYTVPIPPATGGHGGADPQLQARLFENPDQPDELDRDAFHGQGSVAMLIGAAANQSFITGKPVTLHELCPEFDQAVKLTDLP